MPLHFKQSGSGPPLVLIHGLFGSLENLGALARHLSTDFTVYSVDLPNHGRSHHVDEFDLSSMASDLAAWLQTQHLGRVSLVGHSLGGKVAMELALISPASVDKLVVVDIAPVAYAPHHNVVFSGLLAIRPSMLKNRSEADDVLKHYVPEPEVRSFLLKNLQREKVGGFSWRMNLAGIHHCYARLVDANSEAGFFDGRVLFIKGGDSDYILRDYWPDVQKRFARADVKIIPGAGHWVHAEKPELTARTIRRFLHDKSA